MMISDDDTLPGYRRFRPIATDGALVRVVTALSEAQYVDLYFRASDEGLTVREYIGRIARAADRWQDVLLVEVDEAAEAPEALAA